MMQCVGLGMGIWFITMEPGPDPGLWSWNTAAPADDSWATSGVGHLGYTSGLSTIRTAASGMFNTSRGACDASLPAQGPHSPHSPATPTAPRVSELLGLKLPGAREPLTGEKIPREGLDCETCPTLGSVAISTTAFGLHFQDMWKSFS